MQITSEELVRHDDLELFAEYLGIDYEDFYEMTILETNFDYEYELGSDNQYYEHYFLK
tara:strand:- start:121 stop:294 length:174 start_codon:yes stop_codon:yes gene_type:complete